MHVRALACVCARMCACTCVPVHMRRSEYNLRVRYLPPLRFRNQIQVIRLVQHVLLPVAPSRAGHPSDGRTQENWELGESIQKQPSRCGLRWRSTQIPYKWSGPDTLLFPEHPSLKHPRSDSALPPNKSTPHFRAEPASCALITPSVYTRILWGSRVAHEFFLKSPVFSGVHDFSRFIS